MNENQRLESFTAGYGRGLEQPAGYVQIHLNPGKLKSDLKSQSHPWVLIDLAPHVENIAKLLVQLLSAFDYAKDSYKDVEWIDSSLG
ncbi:hypothetical protein DY000_02027176 [Brassica cretica]|uniref:Uncharacterized protein n=1 Tax=Brassica cretica TaxID=69181 RepID=A0ABQ7EFR2_BRACR|nr:hypothetical protein DY000_02027176 [Brassica cretica]